MRPSWASSSSSNWVLRASRAPSPPGISAAAQSKGSTVTASAPPAPAARAAAAPRSRFTHGSRRLYMASSVTACWYWAAAGPDPPEAATTRPHITRAARSTAMAANWSAATGSRKPISPAASSALDPASVRARR